MYAAKEGGRNRVMAAAQEDRGQALRAERGPACPQF